MSAPENPPEAAFGRGATVGIRSAGVRAMAATVWGGASR